jgi:FtsP/CotA-like multicopper oxidase with cupredoxin domain
VLRAWPPRGEEERPDGSPAGSKGAKQSVGSMGGGPEVLRIKLLGGFSVSVGSRTIQQNEWRLRKAAALVKLLALSPNHRLHREQVMDALWPELGKRAASNNLRGALHAARKVLDPTAGSRYLAFQDESLVLCPEGELWVDVDAFEETVKPVHRSREPTAYKAALMPEINRETDPTNMIWKLIDRESRDENNAISWKFTVGERVKIRLINEMDSDHPMHRPFHIHGAGRFLILSRDGQPEPNLVWKDTVLLRAGETVDILLYVTNPGLWMAHCHIAEHIESEKMFSFEVAPSSEGKEH